VLSQNVDVNGLLAARSFLRVLPAARLHSLLAQNVVDTPLEFGHLELVLCQQRMHCESDVFCVVLQSHLLRVSICTQLNRVAAVRNSKVLVNNVLKVLIAAAVWSSFSNKVYLVEFMDAAKFEVSQSEVIGTHYTLPDYWMERERKRLACANGISNPATHLEE
jgi:hypothetical protein